MIAPQDVPISSSSWLIGAVALLVLGIKSLLGYRRSRVLLSKYITWFALLICTALFFFSIPAFFTADLNIQRNFDLVGEGFFYSSMVAQAAMVWFLMLRTRTSIYVLTVPVALIGLASWLYAIPRANIRSYNPDFIRYFDPRLSTIVIAGLIICLFVPVGIYFLRLAPRQKGKAVLNSVVFGLVYIGIGLVNGGFELVTGQMMTPESVYGIILFFIALLIAALWPRRPDSKPAVQIPGSAPSPEAASPQAPADQTAPPEAQSQEPAAQEEPTAQEGPPSQEPDQTIGPPSQEPDQTIGPPPAPTPQTSPPPTAPGVPNPNPPEESDNLTAPPSAGQ